MFCFSVNRKTRGEMIKVPAVFKFDEFLKNIKLWEKAKITKKKLIAKHKGSGHVFQNCNFIQYDNKLKPYLPELHENEVEYTFNNLVSDEIERETTFFSKTSLNKLEKILNTKDYLAVKSAYNILYYDANGDAENAKRCYETHKVKFDERGKKIYNLLESGFFDSLFLPFLEDLEDEYDNPLDIQETFSSLFESYIHYNPYAIWVNNYTKPEKVYIQIMGRLITRQQAGMYIYGRGTKNISKIKAVLDKFIDEHPNFEYFEKTRKIRKLKACEFLLINKDLV